MLNWTRWLPGLLHLRQYERAWLRHDLAAGLSLSAMLLPVGMAYAVASGVPAVAGLYATVAALLAYALFGPSRVLVLGPDSSLVAIVAGVVLPLAAGDPQRAAALAAALALLAGLLCVLAGVARLGFVTELLSKPIRYGYMNGIALTVLIGQLPALVGVPVSGADLWDRTRELAAALGDGRFNAAALALGGATLTLMAWLRRSRQLPGVLLAMVATTLAVALLDLDTLAGVATLGVLPTGWLVPDPGRLAWHDAAPLLVGALAVALVAAADTSVLSRACATRSGEKVDTNQEMLALGAANLAAGLGHGLPISASSSRTPVALAAGARSSLAGVVGALAVAALLLLAPGLLRSLPMAALAAVVIGSSLALVEVTDLRRIHRIQPWEFWLSLGCSAGVVLLGPIPGIGLAVVIALVEFLWDAWRPYSAVLGRVDGIKGYHDIERHPEARRVPGLVLFRWDAPLFFANAEWFRERVLAAVDAAPQPVLRVVVGAEPITGIDVTAADQLADLAQRLRERGIELCFAELKGPVKDQLRRYGLWQHLGDGRVFATLGEAVSDHVGAHAVDWVDWEDLR